MDPRAAEVLDYWFGPAASASDEPRALWFTKRDETDRETFVGAETLRHTASPGQLLIFDNDYAYQPLGAGHLRKMVLMVTIEGATFHNK